MAVDPTTIELAARLKRLNSRIERLETLEYSTVAFPGGGGLTVLCDVKLVAPAASVLCSFGPAGIPHVMAVVAAGVDTGGGTVAGKIRVLINGIAGVAYEFSTRQEHRLFADTQAVALTGGADLKTVVPAAEDVIGGTFAVPNSATYIFPTPGGSVGTTIVGGAWIGAGQQTATAISHLQELDLGGGGNVLATTTLSSLTFLTTAPDLFVAGSRFTVYGL